MKATGRQRAGARDKRAARVRASARKAIGRSPGPPAQAPDAPAEPDEANATPAAGRPGATGERRPRREEEVDSDDAAAAADSATAAAEASAAKAATAPATAALAADPLNWVVASACGDPREPSIVRGRAEWATPLMAGSSALKRRLGSALKAGVGARVGAVGEVVGAVAADGAAPTTRWSGGGAGATDPLSGVPPGGDATVWVLGSTALGGNAGGVVGASGPIAGARAFVGGTSGLVADGSALGTDGSVLFVGAIEVGAGAGVCASDPIVGDTGVGV